MFSHVCKFSCFAISSYRARLVMQKTAGQALSR